MIRMSILPILFRGEEICMREARPALSLKERRGVTRAAFSLIYEQRFRAHDTTVARIPVIFTRAGYPITRATKTR